MDIVRVRARVATTHAIPAYGGIHLAESALHQMADALRSGAVRMSFNHDIARPMSWAPVSSGVEELEDGESAVWVEFDTDREQWEQYQREIEQAGAPRGFSFSSTVTFATRGEPPYDIAIAADAAHFSNMSTVTAAEGALPRELSVELAELFQFSWVPEPRVLIEIGMAVLMASPGDLLIFYLCELADRFIVQLRHDSPAIFELRVRRAGGQDTQLKLVTRNGDELRKAMQVVPEILRAEGELAQWNGQAGRWEQIARD